MAAGVSAGQRLSLLLLDSVCSVLVMTSTELLPTDAATQKLIDEATAASASVTHPLYSGADLGIDALEFDVHVVGSRWLDSGRSGTGQNALALCGETLVSQAFGLRDSLPMCWECADVLEARS